MAQVSNFFAGANSGAGFQNLFPQLMDLEDTYDFMILKGGPGVGKATFMREIGRSMEEAGTCVEYLWCSGDPDSLDGVVLPELRCVVVDGTPPHAVEPRYPAAVDRIVDLGRFYDLTAAKAAAEDVKEETKVYQAAYVRAYRALNAARQVEENLMASARKYFDEDRANKREEGIAKRELSRKGTERGKTSYRFLGSITYQGYVWRFDSVALLCPRVYELVDQWEVSGELLRHFHEAATRQGWDTIVCLAPEDPQRMEHLLIPGLGLAFVTSRPEMEYPEKPFRRIRLDAMMELPNQRKNRLQHRIVTLLREEGVAGLQDAKEHHDRLEKIYNPYVDFDSVRELAALEAGRLLSYL